MTKSSSASRYWFALHEAMLIAVQEQPMLHSSVTFLTRTRKSPATTVVGTIETIFTPMSLQSIKVYLNAATYGTIKGTPREEEDATQAEVHNVPLDQTVDVDTPEILQKAPNASLQDLTDSQMIIGRLHAIPNWDTASTSSTESDDLPSLADAELDNLEDSHYKLNPLWPENISDSLPSELQPFLLSRPVRRRHLQDNQTDQTGDYKTDHSVSKESSLFGDDETDHSSLFGDDETDCSIDEASTPASPPQDHIALPNVGSQPPAGQHYTQTPSHLGHQIAFSNVGFQPPVGQQYTRRPSHAGHHTALPNDGFQPPAGQHYTRLPPHVGLQHPGGQRVARTPSCAKFQPLPGPHYDWEPSLGASGMIMAPPSNVTSPNATHTGFPPGAQFYPLANASAALPPSTTSFRHLAYIPSTRKWTEC